MTMNAADGQDDLPGDLLYRLEVAELSRPHIVVTRDRRTGRESFSGPYPSAVGALCAAETEYQVDRDGGGLGELTFHVAALYPPLEGADCGGASQASAAGRHRGRGTVASRFAGSVAYAARRLRARVAPAVGGTIGLVRRSRRVS
jgi:hypothetical protein